MKKILNLPHIPLQVIEFENQIKEVQNEIFKLQNKKIILEKALAKAKESYAASK